MAFFLNFLISQLFTNLPIPSASYNNQTIAITGSNTGLGFEAARHFLQLGASKLILCVRNTSKGEAAATLLCTEFSLPRSRIQVLHLDLSNSRSIQQFGEKLKELGRLDVFVQNAGILTAKFELVEGVKDGSNYSMESLIGINVIGAAEVGALALQVLEKSSQVWGAKGRLVFVGSDLFLLAKFKERLQGGRLLDALRRREGCDMNDRYKVSKLLLFFFVRDLADRNPYIQSADQGNGELKRPGVVINYITPGACDTSIFRDNVHWLQQAFINLAVRIVARTAEQGSRTILAAAAPEVGQNEHGAFLMDCKVAGNGAFVDGSEGLRMQRKFIKEVYDEFPILSSRLYDSARDDDMYVEAHKFIAS